MNAMWLPGTENSSPTLRSEVVRHRKGGDAREVSRGGTPARCGAWGHRLGHQLRDGS